jgi:hypothetical protein
MCAAIRRILKCKTRKETFFEVVVRPSLLCEGESWIADATDINLKKIKSAEMRYLRTLKNCTTETTYYTEKQSL